jgi:hypothetical protein
VWSLAARHTQGLSSLLLSLMRRCPHQWAVSSLSFLLFTLLSLFQLPSPSPPPSFFLLALLVECCLGPPPSLSLLLSSSLLTAVALANYQDSNLIGVNNFAIHTVILYFTASTDKPMLNQIYIAGGHLGGGGGICNDGSDEGWHWRAGAAGRQAMASAATAAAGLALEKRRQSAGGLDLAARYYIVSTYLLCEKKRSAKVLHVIAPGSTFFCSREYFFALGSRFLLRSAFFGSDKAVILLACT